MQNNFDLQNLQSTNFVQKKLKQCVSLQTLPTRRRQAKKCGVDTHGECAVCEPISGVSGWSPQRGPGTEPLVRGKAPEAENLLAFDAYGSSKFASFFVF